MSKVRMLDGRFNVYKRNEMEHYKQIIRDPSIVIEKRKFMLDVYTDEDGETQFDHIVFIRYSRYDTMIDNDNYRKNVHLLKTSYKHHSRDVDDFQMGLDDLDSNGQPKTKTITYIESARLGEDSLVYLIEYTVDSDSNLIAEYVRPSSTSDINMVFDPDSGQFIILDEPMTPRKANHGKPKTQAERARDKVTQDCSDPF